MERQFQATGAALHRIVGRHRAVLRGRILLRHENPHHHHGILALVGTGLFGFMINPPIALYYLQGLITTPVHAHAALFGVYGLLALGLVLVVLKRLQPEKIWKDSIISISFWSMNIGLALMVLLSLLPVGLMQTWASIEYGMW